MTIPRLGVAVVATVTGLAVNAPTPEVIAAGCETTRVSNVVYREFDGVDTRLLSLDIDPVPNRCGAPVAVWVHGGGWRVGDKAVLRQQRAAFYNSEGWLLVSVNYRLSAPSADPPIRFPDHNVDAAAALAWVADHVADHGGDPSRLLLVGHSAGAGIAAAVVADPAYLAAHRLDPGRLACTVLLDPVGWDVAAGANGPLADTYRNAFGEDPAVWETASPSTHLGTGPLPRRALIVTRGSVERIAQAETFGAQLDDAGIDAEVVDVRPLGHSDVNLRIGEDDVMTPLMSTELARCSTPEDR